jgi:N6-adenosine-specific RNA methylase IME4
MPLEQAQSSPVGGLAPRDGVLLLWAVGASLDEAVRTIGAWGYADKAAAFTWVKSRGATPHTGMG